MGVPLDQASLIVAVAARATIVTVTAAFATGIRTMGEMLGNSPATDGARKRIAHVYYLTLGAAAVLVGLLNPVGLAITILSAMASSFGGNAGFISLGFAGGRGEGVPPFVIARNWPLLGAGAVVCLGFALILGPSIVVTR